eukprot:326936-Prorocentrum_minimum.AAC.3
MNFLDKIAQKHLPDILTGLHLFCASRFAFADPAARDARDCAYTFQDSVLRVPVVVCNECHSFNATDRIQTNTGWDIRLNILPL